MLFLLAPDFDSEDSLDGRIELTRERERESLSVPDTSPLTLTDDDDDDAHTPGLWFIMLARKAPLLDNSMRLLKDFIPAAMNDCLGVEVPKVVDVFRLSILCVCVCVNAPPADAGA